MATPGSSSTSAIRRPGRQFLHIPGPTNIPERVLNAMRIYAVDQRGAEFQAVACDILERVKGLFQTKQPVIIWPSSGTGAWEAAITNTLSPGDKVLMHETGEFARLWHRMAGRFQLEPVYVQEGEWRRGFDPNVVEDQLKKDTKQEIKAVCVVHNETSNGVVARLKEIGEAIKAANHPALLMVDSISGLGCADLQHDAWGVDVTICGSQKGMMMPTGLGFNAVSEKALEAKKTAGHLSCYWDWDWMMADLDNGSFPYTPAVQLFYALRESLSLIEEEGLQNVFARHQRLAAATRAAVEQWGLEVVALDEREYSPSVTAILLPEGHSGDAFRKVALDRYNVVFGGGLNRFKDKVFRIGHMGDVNEPMILGALGAAEMALIESGVPIKSGGVQAAMQVLGPVSKAEAAE